MLGADIVLNENLLESILNGDGSLTDDNEKLGSLTKIRQIANFAGVFNGDGHKISGLYYNSTVDVSLFS